MRRTILSMFLVAALMVPLPGLAEGAVMSLRAPDAHGQAFDLATLHGHVVVVTFVSRYTRDAAARIHAVLGTRRDVKIVSIVDFVGIPSFVHGYARKKVAQADGRVHHLCDESGELARRFAVHPERHVAMFVLDRDGSVRGRFDGEAQLAAALRLVDEMRNASAER